jgi:hypothetical protein
VAGHFEAKRSGKEKSKCQKDVTKPTILRLFCK